MRPFRLFILILCAYLAIEGGYRWSNGLALSWGWLAYRAGFLAAIVGVSAFFNRRDARRIRKEGLNVGILTAGFLLLFGGAGFGVWTWRVVEALITGRIIVSNSPDTYTLWAENPGGFAVALGLGSLGVAFFLLLFIGGIFLVRGWLIRRNGPAWP